MRPFPEPTEDRIIDRTPARISSSLIRNRGTILSAALHVAALLCFSIGVHHVVHIKPYRLPGTSQGVTLLTYFAPGSATPVHSPPAPVKKTEKPKAIATHHDTSQAPQPPQTRPKAESGIGATNDSGLGEGDITIALQTYFPHPAPDLSSLPHGTRGDVILNAVIDEHGNIAELTLLKGLGSPIDQAVIAIVQQWRYTPAMRKGVPITSEQELHFHYERG